MRTIKWIIPVFALLAFGCQQNNFNGRGAGSSDPASADAQPQKALPPGAAIFQDCNEGPDLPMVADLYMLPEGTQNLPDFKQLQPIKTICLAQLNISNRDFQTGFPGVSQVYEWFGLVIRFRVKAPVDGSYLLEIASDDGSKTFIDGQQILDNDGAHAVKSQESSVSLKQGWHDVVVEYFQGPRYSIALELFWQMPNETQKNYIPSMYLSRPMQP